MEVLNGHVSPETAYVVDDYPYGFRLRCKIRYWVEYRKGFGYRFMSQTTNPKREGEVWNKPKAGNYCTRIGMVKDSSDGYIHYRAISPYSTKEQIDSFNQMFGSTYLPARPE